jgi:hypothetical protein
VPFTPGGAGVQQAFLVKVFGGAAAAYSVGQQIAIAVCSLLLGFIAITAIFRFRSFGDVIRAGRAAREAEREGDGSAAVPATEAPGAPRARA